MALILTDSLGGCEVLKASNPKRSENAFYMYVSHLLRFPLGLSAFSRTLAKIDNIFELTKELTGNLKIFVITSLVESDKVESLECRV